MGVARALGYRFLGADGKDIATGPGALASLVRIERPAGAKLPEVVAACDVQNPLLGDRGAARVYGPQKGADPCTVQLLEAGLSRLADVCVASLGCDHRGAPGAGAAGGLGFGLLTFCDAVIESGFDIFARTARLAGRVAAADIVVTGEGRIDEQTLEGKGPAGVAALARESGKRVVAFAGSVSETAERAGVFDAIIPIEDRPMALAEAVHEAAALLERASFRAAKLITLLAGN
jgi:glycerate kinase